MQTLYFTQIHLMLTQGIKKHMAGFAICLGRQNHLHPSKASSLRWTVRHLLITSFVQVPLGVSHCPPFSGGSSLPLKTLLACEFPQWTCMEHEMGADSESQIRNTPYSKFLPPTYPYGSRGAAQLLHDPRWLVKVRPSNPHSASKVLPWVLWN